MLYQNHAIIIFKGLEERKGEPQIVSQVCITYFAANFHDGNTSLAYCGKGGISNDPNDSRSV